MASALSRSLARNDSHGAYAQDIRLVEVNTENLRGQQEHHALAQARLRAGVGIPLDVVMAETAVADAIGQPI